MALFRIATTNDIETIAHLHAASWKTTYRGMLSDDYLDNHVTADRIKVWTERIEQPAENQRIILCVDDQDSAMGFVCAYGSSTDPFGTFIDNLHAAPELKGRGVGRKLMRKVYEWSLEVYHQPKIYLKVLEDNLPARGFYEKVGGVNQATLTEVMPGGNTVKACRFVWDTFEF